VSKRAFYWAELKTTDFRNLNPEATIAILPVAATEQHGPHLPVMTDTAIAQGMLDLLEQHLPPDLTVLVLPIQSIGKSNEHLLSVRRNASACADRDLRGRLSRRLKEAGAGQLPRRQCVGAIDRYARIAGAVRHVGGCHTLALVWLAERHVRRR
jgi:hypothetical protein